MKKNTIQLTVLAAVLILFGIGSLGYYFGLSRPAISNSLPLTYTSTSFFVSTSMGSTVTSTVSASLISSATGGVSNSEAQADVKIVSSSSYMDSVNFTHIVGEIENLGSLEINSAEITATFYNSQNQTVGKVSTYSLIKNLAPGKKSPFDVLAMHANLKVSSYSIQVISAEFSTVGAPAFLAIQDITNYTDSIGVYHVIGEIENAGLTTVNSTQVVITFYDRSGVVAAAGWAETDPPVLTRKQIAHFDVLVTHNQSQISSFIVQAQTGAS